ncbi:YhcH/YjgK/YiaL family protein [Dysgonomonas macrotermitis]|uniref:YhcH/YjgK/YiaL family protein n=1 Tax=Dysgonomonas macrotermitis TaxID=1346286 RepID=A0A1M4ZUQ2_9BACT|nr:YhcH/YjgK/YiaL family protein [Dysgonomonas macrotermitis]SHF21748.1 YhcH/YjgK/YiaL family protein [Dysgonomonas macrotermitis]
MIIDNLSKLAEYATLNPHFGKAIEFIKSLDLKNPELGKFEIDGKNVFASISESKLKTPDVAKLEVHNNYIDIQIPVSKAEGFGWIGRSELKKETAPFDETKDIQFFEDKPILNFDLQPGNFAIFFPQDGHAPCIGEGTVIKIVIKIKVA